MRIIKKTTLQTPVLEYPDVFASEKEKNKDSYVKTVLDYFDSIARMKRREKGEMIGKNYRFFKGELTKEDFYEQDDNTIDFVSMLEESFEKLEERLPKYVQNYTIMKSPIDTLVGETCKKPDNSFVKAYDEDSQSEQLAFMTDNLTQYAQYHILSKLRVKAAQQGVDVDSEEFMTQIQPVLEKELEEKLSSYTSLAERWANRMLENLKMEFNLKEVREEMLSDLLKSGYLYAHVYEDTSSLGFSTEVVNPVNYWQLALPDKKYAREAYAAGISEVLELSQIIEKFSLTKKEVDALLDKQKTMGVDSGEMSHLHPYYSASRTAEDFRELEDDRLRNELEYQLGLSSRKYPQTYGTRFLVNVSYHKGKIKVGKLRYFDEEGIPQSTFVDENYKSGDHPYEIDLVWGYYNQIYKGIKIGESLYDLIPLEFTDRIPIAGGQYDPKNSKVKAFMDYMKPIQVLYNVCMNQLFELLNKEYGVVYNMNIRKISTPKDGENEDALDNFEEEARKRGIVFEDDSPENMKVPGNNTNNSRAIDLTRTNEIQSRYTLAQQLKLEAWSMVGINQERLGGVAASQTATGTQAAISASYSQTEPWMTFHEYCINDLYQLLLDTAQYFESQKPESTVSYISGEGESAFIRVNRDEFSLRDLRVFVTSRSEDLQILQSNRDMAKFMLQNGADAYDVAKLQSSKSIRAHEDMLRRMKERKDEFQQQQQQIEQQKNEAIQQQTQAMVEMEQAKLQNTNMNNQADRESAERIAGIQAASRQGELADNDGNGIPDAAETLKHQREQQKMANEQDFRTSQLKANQNDALLKNQYQMDKNRVEVEKLKTMKEEGEKDRKIKEQQINSQEKIAKMNKN